MTQITLLPKPDDLPDFEAALAHLGAVPNILYEALEHAAFETSRFRNRHSPKKKLDPGLSASLFRFHCVKFLQSKGIKARVDGWRLMLNHLPFLGISFYYDGYHVRVLKGPNGVLPGCGPSNRKKRFYRQIPTNYLVGPVPYRTTANIIVLWDHTPSYALSKLWLTLPAIGALRQQDVAAFWINPIAHPAGANVNQTSPSDGGLGDLISKVTDEQDKQVSSAGRESSTGT